MISLSGIPCSTFASAMANFFPHGVSKGHFHANPALLGRLMIRPASISATGSGARGQSQ